MIMPRKPRIDIPGYHHVINRGVNRENVFLCNDDKNKGSFEFQVGKQLALT